MFNTDLMQKLSQIKLPETPKQELERLKKENAKLREELQRVKDLLNANK